MRALLYSVLSLIFHGLLVVMQHAKKVLSSLQNSLLRKSPALISMRSPLTSISTATAKTEFSHHFMLTSSVYQLSMSVVMSLIRLGTASIRARFTLIYVSLVLHFQSTTMSFPKKQMKASFREAITISE